MKKISEQNLQQRMQQVPKTFSSIPFDEVIAWVYAAPAPKPKNSLWLWRWLWS